jgi:hypothetical protein
VSSALLQRAAPAGSGAESGGEKPEGEGEEEEEEGDHWTRAASGSIWAAALGGAPPPPLPRAATATQLALLLNAGAQHRMLGASAQHAGLPTIDEDGESSLRSSPAGTFLSGSGGADDDGAASAPGSAARDRLSPVHLTSPPRPPPGPSAAPSPPFHFTPQRVASPAGPGASRSRGAAVAFRLSPSPPPARTPTGAGGWGEPPASPGLLVAGAPAAPATPVEEPHRPSPGSLPTPRQEVSRIDGVFAAAFAALKRQSEAEAGEGLLPPRGPPQPQPQLRRPATPPRPEEI